MGIHCVLLIFLLLKAVRSDITDASVTTKVGTFTGFTEEVDVDGNKVKISKFLGIPYAEPPVGDFRFRKSVAKASLKEPLITQKHGSQCLQINFGIYNGEDGSEDCLFLNIYKPGVETNEGTLPVMVWIHGGGFIMGSSASFFGDALVANGPVVVVTFNYRLAAWGFLSTEDSNAPGNYGLWDQHLAIKWVHDNIGAFGGDVNRVTIFGQSAGSASVIFQGLFPGNVGLFQRMIAESGTAVSEWAVKKNPKADAAKLASLAGCNDNDSKEMADCLRRLPAEKINATLNDMSNELFQPPLPFVPSLDKDFVEVLPRDILNVKGNLAIKSRNAFASYDLIIGFNSGEGGLMISPLYGVYNVTPEQLSPTKSLFDKTLVPSLVKILYGKDAPNVLNEAVINMYTDWEDPENPESIRQLFCSMHGDSMFNGGTYRTINAHADMSDRTSYLYYFNILPDTSFFTRPSWFNKALHGDELLYVFGNKIDARLPGLAENRELKDWEKEASKNIMALWTNFAKTGNPNQPRDIGVDWLPYITSRHSYLEILNNVTSSKVKERLFEQTAIFWDTFLPSLDRNARCKGREPSDDGTCRQQADCSP